MRKSSKFFSTSIVYGKKEYSANVALKYVNLGKDVMVKITLTSGSLNSLNDPLSTYVTGEDIFYFNTVTSDHISKMIIDLIHLLSEQSIIEQTISEWNDNLSL